LRQIQGLKDAVEDFAGLALLAGQEVVSSEVCDYDVKVAREESEDVKHVSDEHNLASFLTDPWLPQSVKRHDYA